MQPTLQNVFDDARGRLNDIAVAGGEIFTNAVLQVHFAASYREMYDLMGTAQVSRIQRSVYWNLPAYTELLDPVGTMTLQDFAEPVFVEERGSVTSTSITSSNTASPIQLAAPSHGLATNAEAIVSGVAGTRAPWGRWFVTVLDGNDLTLNGSVSDGNAGTGGTLSTSTEKFTEVDPVDRFGDRDLSDHLLEYYWDEGVLRFRGANTLRQLRITYRASGMAPTLNTQTIGIDNCLNYLGCRTAARAANSKGWTSMAETLTREACGPNMEADGTGGLLWNFLNLQVTAMQRKQRRRRPFRKSRNQPDYLWL